MLICLLSCFVTVSSQAQTTLPDILDYYPSCQYEITDTLTIEKKFFAKNRDRVQRALLESIQRKAKVKGANAIVLLDQKITHKDRHSSSRTYDSIMSYHLQLLNSQCDRKVSSEQVTPYNSQGNKNLILDLELDLGTHKTKKRNLLLGTYKHTPAQKNISIDKNISINGSIYGVAMGTSIEQVTDKLGPYNVVVRVNDKQRIIGYGRNNWFYFEDNKLFGFATDLPLIPQYLLNAIPFVDRFDDSSWFLENALSTQTASVKGLAKLYKGKTENISEDAIQFAHNNVVTIVNFDYFLDVNTDKRNQVVTGVQVFDKRFTAPKLSEIKQLSNTISIDESIYQELLKKGADRQNFRELFGHPWLTIATSDHSSIQAYNNNVTVEELKSGIYKISFGRKIISSVPIQPWFLGPFKQKAVKSTLKDEIQEELFELNNRVQFYHQDNGISLTFDGLSEQALLSSVILTLL